MKNKNFVQFYRFAELFFDVKTKKAARSLQEDAKNWFSTYYGAIFDYGEGKRPLWKYQAGMLILYIPGYGSYYYLHIIKLLHYHAWDVPYYKEGQRYYNRYEKQRNTHRDDNPYTECNFYAHDAWDSGYLIALAQSDKRFRLPDQIAQ